ncbi:multidrug and toxin extrusion protein 1-like, partial [Saccoglossus kowalevskii]
MATLSWSRECLQDWGVITKLGVAGVLMLATEWWVFEIAVFLMGAEGEIAVGAQGALLQIVFVLSMPSLGVWIAASIRVGNCLGANQPKQAKQAAVISLISIGIISTVCAVILLCLKDFVGKVFTQEVEVVNEISRAIPLLALLLLVDPLGVVSMGILQGCGLQKVAAIVNCVIYYVISLPLMCVLVLVFDLSVM